MPQYTFTSDKEFIETEVQAIADRENRSRSEMIDILLHRAAKEANRKRNGKKIPDMVRGANPTMER